MIERLGFFCDQFVCRCDAVAAMQGFCIVISVSCQLASVRQSEGVPLICWECKPAARGIRELNITMLPTGFS